MTIGGLKSLATTAGGPAMPQPSPQKPQDALKNKAPPVEKIRQESATAQEVSHSTLAATLSASRMSSTSMKDLKGCKVVFKYPMLHSMLMLLWLCSARLQSRPPLQEWEVRHLRHLKWLSPQPKQRRPQRPSASAPHVSQWNLWKKKKKKWPQALLSHLTLNGSPGPCCQDLASC